MDACVDLAPEMLPNRITVFTKGSPRDLTAARAIAEKKVRQLSSDPLLLAWFDRKSGRFSPNVICCDESKPAWLVYAESRGGNVAVDINDQEYVFVYWTG